LNAQNITQSPAHLEYLNLEGIEKITPKQIDAFASLLSALKKSNVVVIKKIHK
jgi:hypothetical protein